MATLNQVFEDCAYVIRKKAQITDKLKPTQFAEAANSIKDVFSPRPYKISVQTAPYDYRGGRGFEVSEGEDFMYPPGEVRSIGELYPVVSDMYIEPYLEANSVMLNYGDAQGEGYGKYTKSDKASAYLRKDLRLVIEISTAKVVKASVVYNDTTSDTVIGSVNLITLPLAVTSLAQENEFNIQVRILSTNRFLLIYRAASKLYATPYGNYPSEYGAWQCRLLTIDTPPSGTADEKKYTVGVAYFSAAIACSLAETSVIDARVGATFYAGRTATTPTFTKLMSDDDMQIMISYGGVLNAYNTKSDYEKTSVKGYLYYNTARINGTALTLRTTAWTAAINGIEMYNATDMSNKRILYMPFSYLGLSYATQTTSANWTETFVNSYLGSYLGAPVVNSKSFAQLAEIPPQNVAEILGRLPSGLWLVLLSSNAVAGIDISLPTRKETIQALGHFYSNVIISSSETNQSVFRVTSGYNAENKYSGRGVLALRKDGVLLQYRSGYITVNGEKKSCAWLTAYKIRLERGPYSVEADQYNTDGSAKDTTVTITAPYKLVFERIADIPLLYGDMGENEVDGIRLGGRMQYMIRDCDYYENVGGLIFGYKK